MNIREVITTHEESLRQFADGILKRIWTALPVKIEENSEDGHVATARSTLKGIHQDEKGRYSRVDMPKMADLPIFHIQGGKNVTTNPVTKGDEGIVLFLSRHMDVWHQQGDIQKQLTARISSLSDGVLLPGVRSDPRKLFQVSKDSQQHRSEDQKHVVDVNPDKGVTTKSVDSSEPPASEDHSPFNDAKKFYHSKVHGDDGIEHRAEDSGNYHRVEVTHDKGSRVLAENDKHELSAHTGGLTAKTEKMFQIATKLGTSIMGGTNVDSISGGQAGFQQGAFGILSAMMANGKPFSFGADELGGDLRGKLPEPIVVSILHVADAHLLPNYASPEEAQANGVKQGHLFRTGPMMMIQILEDPQPGAQS